MNVRYLRQTVFLLPLKLSKKNRFFFTAVTKCFSNLSQLTLGLKLEQKLQVTLCKPTCRPIYK